MAKTEVYSWRIDSETKMGLEEEARREGISLAQLMDRMARQLLENRRRDRKGNDQEQARINAAVAQSIGTIAAGPDFSQDVSTKVRTRLKQRYAR